MLEREAERAVEQPQITRAPRARRIEVVARASARPMGLDVVRVQACQPVAAERVDICLLYTSPSPRDAHES
eukprot:662561-Prymnesium_polylepis.1